MEQIGAAVIERGELEADEITLATYVSYGKIVVGLAIGEEDRIYGEDSAESFIFRMVRPEVATSV